MQPILTVVVGFLLTTVLGGYLGTWFQRRAWDHQRRSQLAEDELRRAGDACETVTRLMDRRLYRMLRLYYLIRRYPADAADAATVEAKLADYDSVLYEWNEQLNLNLALIGTYFGEAARDWLSSEIYDGFQSVGSRLEALYRQHKAGERPTGIDELEADLLGLNDAVYRLGLFMMAQLRAGTVGRAAPSALPAMGAPGHASTPPPRLAGIN